MCKIVHVQNSAVCEEAFWAKQIEKYFGDRAVLYPVLHTTIYVCVVCVCDLFWVAWRKRKRASFLNNKCNNTTKHTRSHTYPEWNQIKQQLLRFLVHATIKKKKYTRPMYMWMWCLFSVYSCLCVVLCVFLFILWHCKLKASSNRKKTGHF